ncbi:MAG: hypothetical protein ACQEP1_04450 [Nanobdellota archaeon]
MKKILRIAAFELKRSGKVFDKRVLAFIIPSMILILLFFFFFLQSGDFFENRFYSVDYDGLEPLFEMNGKMVKAPSQEADIKVLTSRGVYIRNRQTLASKAATESLLSTIKRYNNILYKDKPSPVMIKTELVRIDDSEEDNVDLEDLEDSGTSIDEKDENEENDSLGGSGAGEASENDTEVQDSSAGVNLSSEAVSPDEDLKTPSQLSPMLPFKPVYLALSVIVVLTFLSLTYSNRIYDEKVNKKGLLLLTAPVKKYQLIMGKTLPHMLFAFILSLGISLIRTQKVSLYLVLILLAITLVYYSISFFMAVLSRSFRELSFTGIFFISMYSLFLLVPAFMISFSEASMASPLTAVVKILMGESITLGHFLFAFIPQVLLALLFFFIGSKIMTGENLFTYKNLPSKIIDAFDNFIRKPYYILLASMGMIPFVFLTELLLIVVLISSNDVMLLVLLLGALTEEFFKSLGIYTVLSRRKFRMNNARSLVLGFLAGLGFFIGEKLLLLVMIKGFIKQYALIILSGLFVPLVLHIVLSMIFSFMTYKLGRRSYLLNLIVVSALHFSANYFLAGGLV